MINVSTLIYCLMFPRYNDLVARDLGKRLIVGRVT